MTPKTFSYEACGQILIIHLPKEFDHHNCRNLKYETDLLLAENYIRKIVFGVLLNRYKQMKANGGRTTLYGVSAQVGRVLSVGGITRIIEHFNTRDEAMAG